LLITDLLMPGIDGEQLLRAAQKAVPGLAVVVMSALGSVDRAVALLHAGATDYLSKPLTEAAFRARIGAVLERVRLRDQARALRDELDAGLDVGPGVVIGTSPAMLAVWRRLRRVARTTAPVILRGESGTGKEVLARALHAWSPRARGPMVTVNCGAIPEGL